MKKFRSRDNRKIFLIIFFSCSIISILSVIAAYAFRNNNRSKSEEVIVQNVSSKNINLNNQLNVDLERYYYDLGLLADEPIEVEQEVISDNSPVPEVVNPIVVEPQVEEKKETPIIVGSQEPVEQKEQPSEEEIQQLIDTVNYDENEDISDIPLEEPNLEFSDFDDGWDETPTGVPGVPMLFEPNVQTTEEYILYHPNIVINEEPSADFFDDFYVAGEDASSLYVDGLYYLTLYINGEQYGDIEVKIQDSKYLINSQQLMDYVYTKISPDAQKRLFEDYPEYYPVETLNDLGVESNVDVEKFEVHLEFSLDDMPLIVVSLNSFQKSFSVRRNSQYAMSNSEVLEPSFFSLATQYSLSLYNSSHIVNKVYNNTISLNMSHLISIGAVAINISNQLTYYINNNTGNTFDFTVNQWYGFYDFFDKSLRLSFGNVGNYLGTGGIPVGFVLEKSYAYGDSTPLPHRFSKSYLIERESTVEISLNGEVILTRRVSKGEYKFKDFAFKQGINHLVFKITPDDSSYDVVVDEFDIPYDTRLLAKSDYLWGVSGSFNKTVSTANSAAKVFSLPYFDGTWYDYNLSQVEFRYWFTMGLTDTFTLNSSFAIKENNFQSNFNGILATMIGSFDGSLTLGFENNFSPNASLSLSHTFDLPIGPINFSALANAPVWNLATNTLARYSSLSLISSYSLPFDNILPVNAALSVNFSQLGIAWSTSLSSSYSPASGISMNASVAVDSQSLATAPRFSLQMGLSFALDEKVSASTSFSSAGSSSVSMRYTPNDSNSIQFGINGINYTKSNSPSISASWLYSGTLGSVSLRENISDDFALYSTNLNLSMAMYYASGLFAFSNSVSNNFLILKASGSLKGNDISIGRTNNSNPDVLPSVFGNVVYTGLSANIKNNIIVYGSSGSLYGSGGTFSFELNPTTRQGYGKILVAPQSYTVSGLLYNNDGTPYVQYSSPVYRKEIDENGKEYLQIDDKLYLFTDLNGRFILSDVLPGEYVFDLSVGDKWYAMKFIVPDEESYQSKVIILEDYYADPVESENVDDLLALVDLNDNQVESNQTDVFGTDITTGYDKVVSLNIDMLQDETQFWQTIFPTYDDSSESTVTDPFSDTSDQWEDTSDSQNLFVEDDSLLQLL